MSVLHCGRRHRVRRPSIIADLGAASYVIRARPGRPTIYTVHLDCPFWHPAQDGYLVGPDAREHLERAALALFTEHRYDATTVTGIAAAPD